MLLFSSELLLLGCGMLSFGQEAELEHPLDLKLSRIYSAKDSDAAEWFQTLEGVANDLGSPEIQEVVDSFAQQLGSNQLVIDHTKGEKLTEEMLVEYKAKTAVVLSQALSQIDDETQIKIVQASNIIFLRKHCQKNNIVDPSFLSIPVFVNKMALEPEKLKDIQDIEKDRERFSNKALSSYFSRIREFDDEKLRVIRTILSPEQNAKFSELIGSPVAWDRLVSSSENFSQRISESNNVDPERQGYALKLPKDGSVSRERFDRIDSPKTLDKEKVLHVDIVTFILISSSFFREEAELSKEQIVELAEYVEYIREHGVVSGRFVNIRFDELLAGSPEWPADLEMILLPQQLKWLRNAALQFFTAKNRDTFGLTHPELVRLMKLSNKQIGELETVGTMFSGEVAEMRKSARDELIDIGLDFAGKKIAILSVNERNRWTRLTGIDCSRLDHIMDTVVGSRNDEKGKGPDTDAPRTIFGHKQEN